MDGTIRVGDEVLIFLRAGLTRREFGHRRRIGHVVQMGTDLLAGEPVIELDDDGPRIYAAHIDHYSILTRRGLSIVADAR